MSRRRAVLSAVGYTMLAVAGGALLATALPGRRRPPRGQMAVPGGVAGRGAVRDVITTPGTEAAPVAPVAALVSPATTDVRGTGGRGEPGALVWARRAATAAVYAMLAVIAVALLAVTLPGFGGYHAVVVYGGSMGDALPAGSVAVTRRVDAAALREGDVIAIGTRREGEPILHRVVGVEDVGGRRYLTTRGDANDTDDPRPIAVEGEGERVAYHLPWLGYVLVFARTPLGLALCIGLPGVIWLGRQLMVAGRGGRRVARQAA